jgi:hypothetical protein
MQFLQMMEFFTTQNINNYITILLINNFHIYTTKYNYEL